MNLHLQTVLVVLEKKTCRTSTFEAHERLWEAHCPGVKGLMPSARHALIHKSHQILQFHPNSLNKWSLIKMHQSSSQFVIIVSACPAEAGRSETSEKILFWILLKTSSSSALFICVARYFSVIVNWVFHFRSLLPHYVCSLCCNMAWLTSLLVMQRWWKTWFDEFMEPIKKNNKSRSLMRICCHRQETSK